MLGIIAQIREDWKNAMKHKEKVKVRVLSGIRSEIKYAQIKKSGELDNSDVISIIQRAVKMHRDSIIQFKSGNREDLVSVEEQELRILEQYLPEQMTDKEIEMLVRRVINEISAEGSSDIGKVMRAVMPLIKGKAEGKKVNRLVRKSLGE